MEKLQAERNALLLYVLQHPPPGVVIRLPPHCSDLSACDLSQCPLPLDLYTRAEAASRAEGKRKADSKSRRALTSFEVHLGDHIAATFESGGNGGVARQAAGAGSPTPASPVPPTATATTAAAASPGHGVSSSSEPPSPPHSTRNRRNGALVVGGRAEALQAIEEAPRSLTNLVGTLLNSGQSGSGGGEERRHAPQLAAPRGRLVAWFNRMRHGDAAGPASAHGQAGATPSSPFSAGSARHRGGDGLADSLELSTQSAPMIPLNGTTRGTIGDHLVKALDAVTGGSRAGAGGALTAASLPPAMLRQRRVTDPISIELFPIFDQTMLSVFDESATLTVYEHILCAANFMMDTDKDKYEREIFQVYRSVFAITEVQHVRCLGNLIPPHLREGTIDRSSLRTYIRSIHPDMRTLRMLVAASSDEDYVSRTTALLEAMAHYPDDDGVVTDRTLYPLAFRASLFAVSLVPIYRLDPKTQQPLHTMEQIANCVGSLRRKLQITPAVEEYCHLHARLLANDDDIGASTQCLFLKHVAKAVNKASVRCLEHEALTPEVKYAFFVLQEMLGMAMAPMPWFETICESKDALRSVSAVFLETCAVLPTCFLSAFVYVNGNPVLPPAASNGTFLYGFLSIFIAHSVLRLFNETGEAQLDRIAGAAASSPRQPRAQRLAAMLKALALYDRHAREYCGLLQRSLAMAPCLLLPARFGLAGHVLAARMWGGDAAKAVVDVRTLQQRVDDVEAVLPYLSSAAAGTVMDDEITLVVSIGAARYLHEVGAAVEQCDAFHFAALKQLTSAPPAWAWAARGGDDTMPPPPVMEALARFGCPQLPAPLGPHPHALQTARLRSYVSGTRRLVALLAPDPPVDDAAGLPMRRGSSTVLSEAGGGGGSSTTAAGAAAAAAVAGSFSGSPSALMTEYSQLTAYHGARRPLGELLQRLHAVHQLQRAAAAFFAESTSQYQRVAAVTGAAAVATDGYWDRLCASFISANARLCEWIGAALLAVPGAAATGEPAGSEGEGDEAAGEGGADDDGSLCSTMLHRYMRRDTAQGKHRRRGLFFFDGGKEKDANRPLPRLFPQVTAVALLRQFDNLLAAHVADRVPLPALVGQVRAAAAHYFVLLMALVYTERDVVEDVFLTPADAPELLHDVEAVSAHFFGDAAPAPVARDSAAGHTIDRLERIVRYVMSQPSATLVNGGEGVPRYAGLPDVDENTPWCKQTVIRVLARRRDRVAKQAVANKR